jgi:hypothetical protein
MEKLDFTKNVEFENTPGSIAKIIVSIVEANKTVDQVANAEPSAKQDTPPAQKTETTTKQNDLDIAPRSNEDKKETYDTVFTSSKADDIEAGGSNLNPESISVNVPPVEEPTQEDQKTIAIDSVAIQPDIDQQKTDANQDPQEPKDQQPPDTKQDADQSKIVSQILQEVQKIESALIPNDSDAPDVKLSEQSTDIAGFQEQLKSDQQEENRANAKFEKIQKEHAKIFNNIYNEVSKIEKSLEKDRFAAEEAEREAQVTREKDVELKQEQKTEDKKQDGFFENMFGMLGFGGLFKTIKDFGKTIFDLSKNIFSLVGKIGPMLSRLASGAGGAISAAGKTIASGLGTATSFLTGGLGVGGLMTSSAGAALSGSLGAGAAIGAGGAALGAAAGGFYAGDYIAEKAGVGIYGWAQEAEKQGEQAAKAAENEPDELKKLQLEVMALENKANAERNRSLGGAVGLFRKEGVASEETLQQIKEKREKMNKLASERKKAEQELKAYKESMGLEEPASTTQSTDQMQTVSVGQQTPATTESTQSTTVDAKDGSANTDLTSYQTTNAQLEYETVTVGDNIPARIDRIPETVESVKATNEAQTSASMTVNEVMRLANMQTSQKASAAPVVNQVTVNNSSQSYNSGGQFRRPIEPEVSRRRT